MIANDDCRTILSLFRLGMNVIKYGCADCQHQSDKVICLGEEQAFLIKLLFADNLQWDIQDQKIHILDEEFKNSALRCKERLGKAPDLWNEQCSKDKANEERKIKCYIQSQYGKFRHWNKVCEPVVLVLAINSCNNVMDRDTLTHLCMNSQYGAVWFRKVIMKVLSLLAANWFDHEKLEEVAKFLIDFLKGLLDYEYHSDLDANFEERRECLCKRIQTSNIDMLYKEVRLRDREEKHKRWVKGEDILQYFADMEHRNRIYYASRLGLIQRILVGKGVQEELWLPENLVQCAGEIEGTNYTKKIREVIDSIDVQDARHQKEVVEHLSKMIDLCVTDWIDEEVANIHKFVHAG